MTKFLFMYSGLLAFALFTRDIVTGVFLAANTFTIIISTVGLLAVMINVFGRGKNNE